jgi:hypothetical protein
MAPSAEVHATAAEPEQLTVIGAYTVNIPFARSEDK